MSRFTYPLDTVTVASPCQVSWDAMQGDDRTRFCLECQRTVYNLSEMSREEAIELVERKEDRLCVRFYRRFDGTIMTSDCPVALRALRRKLAILAGLAASLLLGLLGMGAVVFASTRHREDSYSRLRDVEPFRAIMEWLDPTPPPMILMGDVCLPPTPPTVTPPAGQQGNGQPAPDGEPKD